MAILGYWSLEEDIQEQWSDSSSPLQVAACLRLSILSPDGSCPQSVLQDPGLPLLAGQRTAGIFLSTDIP